MRTSRRSQRAPEVSFAGGVAARYIETSALIAARLEGDQSAWESIRGEGVRFTSALTLAEFGRRLIRAREAGELDQAQVQALTAWLARFARRCAIVDVDAGVLARVRRPFSTEPIRTLDAIHLATVETRDEDPALVAVVTRDRRIGDNARAMGYLVE